MYEGWLKYYGKFVWSIPSPTNVKTILLQILSILKHSLFLFEEKQMVEGGMAKIWLVGWRNSEDISFVLYLFLISNEVTFCGW